jgi:hypothetical protein
MRSDGKIATMTANDFDVTAVTGHMAGYKLRYHAISNLA